MFTDDITFRRVKYQAGQVTYTLRYSVAAGAGGSFRNRKLWARVV